MKRILVGRDDTHMPAVDGYPTDDVVVIEGL
jgi:hypothetical protein